MIRIRQFLDDPSGAVTVDWVAVTAGLLLVAIVVVYALYNNRASTLVNSVNEANPGFGTTASLFHVDEVND